MIMTKKEAIENHRKMWNWIADQYENKITNTDINGNYGYVRFLKMDYLTKIGTTLDNLKNQCYLCAYAYTNCEYCPLDWGSEDCFYTTDSLYSQLWRCTDAKESSKLSRIIANLPEK